MSRSLGTENSFFESWLLITSNSLLLLSVFSAMIYTSAETIVLLVSPNMCRSTDIIVLFNNGMLLGTSLCYGKLSDHLIQFFGKKFRSSLFQGNFMSLPISLIIEIKPRGLKMDANCFNIPDFCVQFQVYSKGFFFLSHATPKILESDKFVPSSSFA